MKEKGKILNQTIEGKNDYREREIGFLTIIFLDKRTGTAYITLLQIRFYVYIPL